MKGTFFFIFGSGYFAVCGLAILGRRCNLTMMQTTSGARFPVVRTSVPIRVLLVVFPLLFCRLFL